MVTPCLFCGGDPNAPDHRARCGVSSAPTDDRYPAAAGWKGTETSRAAAEATDAATYRTLVYTWLRAHGPHTADETADALGVSILTVRPRMSELRARSRVVDTGQRRPNRSGKSAIVWGVVEWHLSNAS